MTRGETLLAEHDGWSTDAAEESLNRLIAARAEEGEEANREAEAWAESVRRYNLARAREWRAERAAYHRHLIAVFEAQAQRHREQLGQLIDEGARS